MKGGHYTLLCCTAFLLTSCLYRETALTPNRIELVHTKADTEYLTAQMDETTIRGIADRYEHHGSGPVEVTVSYDPQSSVNTAMHASNEAARLAKAFALHKVAADVSTLPVNLQGDVSHTYVYYESVDARPPPDCGTLFDGVRNTGDTPENYGFGCTIESAVSRQVARPADLAGRTAMDPGDARRQDVIVDTYRSGTPNTTLPTASSN